MIKFLARFSFKVKMLLLVGIFTGLIGFFASTLLGEWNEDELFSVKERYGSEFYKPSFELMKNLQLHRGNGLQVAKGNQSATNAMMSARAGVNEALDSLATLEDSYGKTIGLNPQYLSDIRKNWDQIVASLATMPPQEGFLAHSNLIDSVKNYIEMYTDQSNLTHDPEDESFYLMEMLSFDMPSAIELAAKLRGQAAGLANNESISEHNINNLLVSHALLKSQMADAVYSVNKANASIGGALTQNINQLNTTLSRFSEEIHQMIKNGKSDRASEEVFALGTAVVNSGFELSDKAIPELQKLLDVRIESMRDKHRLVLVELILGIVVAMILTFLIIRQLLKGLSDANALCKKIQAGKLDNRVEVAGTDEISILVSGIGEMQKSLLQNKQREEASAEELRIASEKTAEMARESKRIADALQVCDTSVMIADNDFNITYLNDASIKMFTDREQELAKELSGFKASDLLGSSVDRFHKNPSHQRNLIAGLTDVYRATINISGATFNLTATPLFDNEGNRSGTVIEWEDITERLAKEKEEKRIAAENLRVRIALDNSSTNTMIADANNNIVYTNQALNKMMQIAEKDIQKDLPRFSAAQLQGSNMDVFHKNPAHQQNIIRNLNSLYQTQIKVGGRTFKLIASPVVDEEGNRLGTVVEWADRTQEVLVEEEVANIVSAASRGDFTRQIDLDGKEGFFKTLSAGLNQLISVTNDGLRDIARVISALARGDLTQRIESDYEGLFKQLKDDTNQTVSKLEEVITKITEASMAVTNGANEIATGNVDLSQRTEEQASSLEETASSMEQMTSSVKHTSENAQQANAKSNEAVEKAETGGQVVQQAVTAMAEINEASKKIADIIGVIDEIAFQTNLLALNAAVEAARAGEQGRGFAVVAGEVRSLAQRSAAAAKEIKDLIRDSVSKVDSGTELVNESGVTLNEIVESIRSVSQMISDINIAAQEQSSSIIQINQTVTQMDEMTQQNAALVEEATAAGEAMASQARSLTELIKFFKLDESRLNSAIATASSAPAPQHSVPEIDSDDDADWQEF